jgi:hypothetical protein
MASLLLAANACAAAAIRHQPISDNFGLIAVRGPQSELNA